jgi:hypothetical protein
MYEKSAPSFRRIAAPLDVDDAALDRINVQLGVPTLTKPVANAKPERRTKSATPAPVDAAPIRAALEKLTVEIPSYLADAMKDAGFAIAAADLVPDGRRSRGKVQ